MLKIVSRIASRSLWFCSACYPLWADQGMAIDPVTCLGCHGDKISAASFVSSVHGKNGCNSCHVQLTDLSRHVKGQIKIEKVSCEALS